MYSHSHLLIISIRYLKLMNFMLPKVSFSSPEPIKGKTKNTTLFEQFQNPIEKSYKGAKLISPTHIYIFLAWYRHFSLSEMM